MGCANLDVVARWLMKSQLQGWGSLNKVVISLVTGARLVNLVVIAAQGIPYYGTPYYSPLTSRVPPLRASRLRERRAVP
jgi:hypothetical protein